MTEYLQNDCVLLIKKSQLEQIQKYIGSLPYEQPFCELYPADDKEKVVKALLANSPYGGKLKVENAKQNITNKKNQD